MVSNLNESFTDNYQKRILDLELIALGVRLNASSLEEEYSVDQLSNEVIYKLKLYLYGDSHAKTIKYEYKVHSTVWDRIKDEWFPEWLKKRVTINFTTHVKEFDCRFKVLYPDFVSIDRKPYIVITEQIGLKGVDSHT